MCPALAGRFLTAEPPGEAHVVGRFGRAAVPRKAKAILGHILSEVRGPRGLCSERKAARLFCKKNHTEVTFILIKQMSNWRLLNRCSRVFCLFFSPPFKISCWLFGNICGSSAELSLPNGNDQREPKGRQLTRSRDLKRNESVGILCLWSWNTNALCRGKTGQGMGVGFAIRQLGVFLFYYAAAAAKSLQSCPTLCDPIGSSPPGSPVPGILQARTLKWVAISFSNTWKWKVKVKSLSHVLLLVTPWTAAHQAPPSVGFYYN